MMERLQTRWIAWLAIVVLLLVATVPAALSAEPGELDPRLLEEFAAAPGGADFMVFLKAQADLNAAASIEGRVERGQYVYDNLRAVANASQARLRADLDALGVPYHPFFIVNAIRVTGDEALARKLAARPEVERVVADPAFDGIDDPPPGPAGPPAIEAVEWNIARVNADDAWGLGYTGQNVVVASCDTGVDWDHPALINQYRGGPAGDHDYNWFDVFDDYAVPTDPDGHGTHTTGTMVGDDGGSNQVGMAPGAQWIACKVNSGSIWKASKYIECWEWFLAPTRVDGSDPDPSKAPHVINNSWSCPGSEGCDPDTLRDAAKALYAAGIAIAKSGGNSGSSCSTITNPGHYPELLATAAFDSSDNIAGFSSRGPVVVDGEIRIKPDIAAPGVGIRSSTPGGNYGSSSGTSMAAPHTAGLIALLWSAEPALIGDLETTFQIVEDSAQPVINLQCTPNGPGGRPNNVWGWGVIDALAAVQTATGTGLGVLEGTVTESGSGTPLSEVALELVPTVYGPQREASTGPGGTYSETLLAVTYDVTATLYGYLPGNGVAAVVSNTITTLDLALVPAATWTLSGTVTEQGSGAPLQATLSLLDTPVSTVSDPATGGYSTAVAEGSYLLRAESPGYASQERAITVQGDLVEDFALQPELTYYVRDSQGPCGPAFDWIDVSATGAAHSLGDDANKYVTMGGEQFTFYGNTYSAFYIGSNGFVTFASTGASYPGGNTIPSTFPPNNAIYAFWDDLNPASGAQGTIYTDLVDGNLYVIQYEGVEHYPNGDPETFEIVLDLDTGAILLQYLTVSDSSWTSVGIENSDGTAGVSYAFHDPTVPADALAVAFYPVVGAPPADAVGQLTGAVTDSDTGDPIADANIVAEAFAGGRVFTFTADATGVYSGSLCADWYTAVASAPGYHTSAAELVEIISDTVKTQDFSLDRTEADLWVTKTVPSMALPGELLTYTIDFGSYGPDTLPWGEVRDKLNPWVDYVSSPGGTYDPVDHYVVWNLYDLEAGFAGTATLVVQVTDTVELGWDICNFVRFFPLGVDAPQDPYMADNHGTVCTTIGTGQHYVYLPIVVKGFGP